MILEANFKKNWENKFRVPSGSTVLLAVSGGMDSMVLCHLSLQAQIPFAVAHCNFQLRGEESDLDEKLVTDFCLRHNILFHLKKFDTKELSLATKTGIQETAREIRYQWFEEVLKANSYAKVATAHHADDNVETLIINLARGCGIAGLHGIPVERAHIIRPLLFATREDISTYCTAKGIEYREDRSNASDDYLRNAIRHNVVPALNSFAPAAVKNINQSIVRFAEAEELYNKAVALELKKLIEKRGADTYVPVLKLQKLRPLNTLVYEIIKGFGFSSAQVPEVIKLMSAESGHYISSTTNRLIKDRDFLIFTDIPSQSTDLIVIEAHPCKVTTNNYTYNFTVADNPQVIDIDKDVATVDLSKVEFPLLLRKWRTGDYLYPIGMGMKKKKVSKLLIGQKMPLHEKENIWVLENQKKIIWVAGLRSDERFKVSASTKKVLIVKRTLVKE